MSDDTTPETVTEDETVDETVVVDEQPMIERRWIETNAGVTEQKSEQVPLSEWIASGN